MIKSRQDAVRLVIPRTFPATRVLTSIVVIAAILGLAGCKGDDPIPKEAPQVREGRFNISVYENVALAHVDRAHWRAAITNGYVDPKESEQPGKISWISPVSNCSVPPVKAGNRVTYLHTDTIFTKTPIFTFTQANVTERAQRYVARWRAEGRDPGWETDAGGDAFLPANVFVTDASKPHTLVLYGPKVLWNLVLAPGVTVESIVLLAAGGGAGVANLPSGTKLHAISKSGLASCRLAPMLPVSTRAGTAERAAEGDSTARQALASRRQAFNTFADWFRTSFGVPIMENAIGGERAASFLVGPAPATPAARLPFKGLKGSEIHLTRADHFVFGSIQTYRTKSMEVILPVARRLAGGDLNTLNKK